MSEAERACDRVAFLQAGRVIALGAPADLRRELRRDSVRVEWTSAPADAAATLAAIAGVGSVRTAAGPGAGTVLHVTVDDASAFVPALFALAGANGTAGGISGIHIHESTLEDAYFQRAGESLGTQSGCRGGQARRERAGVVTASAATTPRATSHDMGRAAALREGARACGALLERDLRAFLRSRSQVYSSLLLPLMLLAILGTGVSDGLKPTSAIIRDGDYVSYLAPGMIAMTALFSSTFSSSSFYRDRDSGLLRTLLASPHDPRTILLGKSLAAMLIGSLQALAILVIAVLIPGIDFAWQYGWAAGTGLVVAGVLTLNLLLSGFALAVSTRIRSMQGFHLVMNLVLFPLLVSLRGVLPAGRSAGLAADSGLDQPPDLRRGPAADVGLRGRQRRLLRALDRFRGARQPGDAAVRGGAEARAESDLSPAHRSRRRHGGGGAD